MTPSSIEEILKREKSDLKSEVIGYLGFALVIGLLIPAPAMQARQKLVPATRLKKVESARHLKIRRAIRALEVAIIELKRADSDFGGYKQNAITAVENARKQLRLALQFDKF